MSFLIIINSAFQSYRTVIVQSKLNYILLSFNAVIFCNFVILLHFYEIDQRSSNARGALMLNKFPKHRNRTFIKTITCLDFLEYLLWLGVNLNILYFIEIIAWDTRKLIYRFNCIVIRTSILLKYNLTSPSNYVFKAI